MTRPFRFGVQLQHLPPARWRESLRRIEEPGYGSVFWPDHFDPALLESFAGAVVEPLAGK